jgi:hypothetical protein
LSEAAIYHWVVGEKKTETGSKRQAMLIMKPVSFCKADPNQPCKDFTEADLRSLAASMQALALAS